MLINQKSYKTIWLDEFKNINVIDQTKLPHSLEILKIKNCLEASLAIKNMNVRGAPLIGVTAAYGFYLGLRDNSSDKSIDRCYELLYSSRPTAVNLKWALDRVIRKIKDEPEKDRVELAINEANAIKNEDIKMCSDIGENGKKILFELADKHSLGCKKNPLKVLTHCNAGWLAAVDWGTALAPIYKACRAGLNIEVWVDETRPRNQGANLTAYELTNENIPCKVIVDNAGGYLMQKKMVDLVIVGSDRTTSNGDVCNKIGTYLKALAAKDNNIPFYVALPYSTIDFDIEVGLNDIPIEIRSEDEISHIMGLSSKDNILQVRIIPDNVSCFNPGFDVTPSNLIDGLITEKGVFKPSQIKKQYLG